MARRLPKFIRVMGHRAWLTPEPLREELVEALRRLAPDDPWIGDPDDYNTMNPMPVCMECSSSPPDHEPDCAWVQARAALERTDR